MSIVRSGRWAAAAAILVVLGCNPGAKVEPAKDTPEKKCGMTIKLHAGASPTCGKAVPEVTGISKSMDEGNVRWRNMTLDTQTIQFEETEWTAIFEEPWPSGGIVIAAKDETPWYHIKSDAEENVSRSYDVIPLLDGCGPQEPAVTADP